MLDRVGERFESNAQQMMLFRSAERAYRPSVRTVAYSAVPVVICPATSDSAPARSRVSSAP